MNAVRVVISGRVQGVGFRWSVQREARRLGIGGWVRNLPDGRVEALFEGEDRAVESAVEFAGRGPDNATVQSARATTVPGEGSLEFRIR